ncbi:MAG: hypothetical protein QXG39_09460 [Candidatus Aenigmatarchaeota archaeon]
MPKLKLAPGTRLTSFLYLFVSFLIASAILFAANIYYNLDTGEIIMEEIQKVTRLIKATAGLIVGADRDLASGYGFEVATSSLFSSGNVVFTGGNLILNAQGQELIFTGGVSGYQTGFRASTSTDPNQSIIYTLPTQKPTSDMVLFSNSQGQLYWVSPAAAGLGDITGVGDVQSGDAFTLSGSGNVLWFHPNQNYTLALTAHSSLSGNATTILPAVTGTNYLTLAANFPFSQNQVLYADNNGLITGGNNLIFDPTTRTLTIGGSGASGILQISGGNYYLGFMATSTLSSNVIYTWPGYPDSDFKVLTSDTNGRLSWQTVAGVGGVTGQGTANQIAFWTGVSSISGDSGLTYDPNTDVLTISGSLVTSLIRSSSGSITLDPAGGTVLLGSGDWIQTSSGFEIGKSGTQILKEMVPIMGFDLPVRTATTSYVKISRDIESYPLGACSPGTQRVHKLVIRYGANGNGTLRIGASTTTLPSTGTDITKGTVRTIDVSIPTPGGNCTSWSQGTDTTDWYVELNPDGNTFMIYQIFLAGYDQIL